MFDKVLQMIFKKDIVISERANVSYHGRGNVQVFVAFRGLSLS